MSVYAYHTGRGLVGYSRISPVDQSADLKLVPGASVSGVVVDFNGKPAAGVRVQLELSPPQVDASANRRSEANDRGEFSFPAVPMGVSHTIFVYFDSQRPPVRIEFSAGEPELQLPIVELPVAD